MHHAVDSGYAWCNDFVIVLIGSGVHFGLCVGDITSHLRRTLPFYHFHLCKYIFFTFKI